jgi:hypothetical protein
MRNITHKLVWSVRRQELGAYIPHADSSGRARSRARMVMNRSNTGIVGSNPVRGMDICRRFAVKVERGPCDEPIPRPRTATKMYARIHGFRS